MATYNVATGFTVPLTINAGDILNVQKGGSVAVTGPGAKAITGAGGTNTISIDGNVISAGAGTRAIELSGAGQKLTIGATGFVYGEYTGVLLNNGGAFGNSGTIIGDFENGVVSFGTTADITLFATSNIMGRTNGMTVGGVQGISLANTGVITGLTNHGLLIGPSMNAVIYNGGSIFGNSLGISIEFSGIYTIVNTGTIVGSSFRAVFAEDFSSSLNVTNSGTIYGIAGIYSLGNTLVTNNGYIYGTSEAAIVLGGNNDTIINNGFLQGPAAVAMGAGNGFFDGRNGLQFGQVVGGAGNDTLFGGVGADDLAGGDDNDQLMGGGNLDRLDGGNGFDFTRYDLGGAVTISLADSSANTGDAAGDVFISIEGVIGSQFADVIVGDGANNTLLGLGGGDAIAGGGGIDTILGGDGIDILFGEAGNDVITGGAGGDVLRGGIGSDTFIYNVGDGGDFIQQLNEGGNKDFFDLRPYFDTIGYAGTAPRAAGLLQVLQNGADTDVYVQGNFMFRVGGVTAAAIDDSYFLFQ